MLKTHLLKLTYTFIVVILYQTAFSQNRGQDFGLFVGTSQYNGDVNMEKAYNNPHWTASLWYKRVYNERYSLRFAITYGELQSSDTDFLNEYQQNREYYFEDHNLYEFSSVVEFNFFEITEDIDENNFSPYLVGGVAVFSAIGVDKWYQAFSLPIGAGLKFRLSPRIELDVEWVFRKTSTDNLDNLAQYQKYGLKRFKQQSFTETKDWYSLLGATFVISFMNTKSPCPVYGEKKKYELIKKR